MKMLWPFLFMGWIWAAFPLSVWPAENSTPADPGLYGNTGFWKVLTAETLQKRQASFSLWYDRINRNPGYLTVGTTGLAGCFGITGRLEFGASLEAYRHVRVGRGEQLSFGQQALGLFGDKTPGSPPLASELVEGSSRVPQLRSPPTTTGALMGSAGYYNLLPFAGLVGSGGAIGLTTFGVKYGLFSETRDAPVGLALHAYFGLPIHKSIDFLLNHPVGTADLQFGFDGIVSKTIGHIAELHWNVGYRHINQPAHVTVFRLAEELPLAFGFNVPLSSRIQLLGESTAEVFIGRHTPNTTFGAEDPVDVTLGLLAHLNRSFSFSTGYQRPINQFGGDKNGFVLTLAYSHLPSGSRSAP